MKDSNMNDSWFFDKNFNGVPDDFFDDDSIKYLDFPLDDVEPNDVGEDWAAKFQQLEPPPNLFQDFSSGLWRNGNDKVKKSSSVSYNEYSLTKQQPQPSTGEASFSGNSSLHFGSSEFKYLQSFRSSSPVSVLESSISSSSCCTENLICNYQTAFVPVKRPRSKRPRLRRQTFPFISASYASPELHPWSASELEVDEITAKKNHKKNNLKLLSATSDFTKKPLQNPSETRKCSHCAVTKTPQWREGPLGPKTLCNACGVRYRSGRLLPEYRPAASPTFVPTLHSNSHKKVLEMRKKTMHSTSMSSMDASEHMVLGY